MIAVSDAWKDRQQRFLLPETFIEISCGISELGVQEEAVASGTNEAVFSDLVGVTGTSGEETAKKYATLEQNLWALDGTRNILPSGDGPYANAGYVSDISQGGSVTLTLPRVHETAIPGVTITWSSEYNEYPHVFSVTAKNGDITVAETTVTDNASNQSIVYLDISNYDSVTVTIHNWNLPNHRSRVDNVYLGHLLTFTKKDIISYTHEQHGDLLTGELPKSSITFTLDNTDGRWNPTNPTGLEKYLSERQKLTVRYGMDIDGTTEWIPGGTFYLSEWSAPANGLEAQFSARDVFEFLLNAEIKGAVYGTLYSLVTYNATEHILPDDALVVADESLKNYSAPYAGDGTAAEMIQKAANAACCILRYDRNGVLHVEPLDRSHTGYLMPSSLAFSHPEVSLSKPLKTVSVGYGAETPYELSVFSSGETQTVDNSFIVTEEQAITVAEWVREILQGRKTVKGELRADPRLDLFDIVTVESKFGNFSPVVLTEIVYTFNGAFRANYTGRVLE